MSGAVTDKERILVTGMGALCAAGNQPEEIWDAICNGQSALSAIAQWDTSGWPRHIAGEIADLNPRALVADRKIHKLIRRSDLFGLYVTDQAVERSGFLAHRESLGEEEANRYSDRSGVYVGSGGGNYSSQYDFFPLFDAAEGMEAFGRELDSYVNPMWLLRSLPNNVLCHVGIRHGLKGSNACITNHSVSGTLAMIEAAEAIRNAEADRALAVAHDAPIEPQALLYYHQIGLIAEEVIRPFDESRDGSLFGEGGAALMLEKETSAIERKATVLGEILGGGVASDGLGFFALREDGGGLVGAIENALDESGLSPGEVGMVVAHGNGTRASDASEAAAIRYIFGGAPPPVTAFKWAFGHLIAASGAIETVLALLALRDGRVPGIATLDRIDSACAGLPISNEAQSPRSDVALVLSRAFGGVSAVLLVRAPSS